jgi:hypothetical protein
MGNDQGSIGLTIFEARLACISTQHKKNEKEELQQHAMFITNPPGGGHLTTTNPIKSYKAADN